MATAAPPHTGDDGALDFRTDPEAPVLRALEISHSLQAHSELRVRIGIRSAAIREKLLADLAPKDTR